MAEPKLTKLELQIMETLWTRGQISIREIQEAFPEKNRPAYTTIQTTVYRLEGKKAVRRVRKISNAHIFEPVVARDVAKHRMLDEILSFFGGRAQAASRASRKPGRERALIHGRSALARLARAERPGCTSSAQAPRQGNAGAFRPSIHGRGRLARQAAPERPSCRFQEGCSHAARV